MSRYSSSSSSGGGCLGFFIAVFFSMPFIIWGAARGIAAIQFNVNCSGYLKRAADANTIEMARGELQKAIAYAENRDLKEGTTRILFDYPSCDVGFWYGNLKASEEELSKVAPETTQLEKTNLMMKLRETLLDQGENGAGVTIPGGISIFPYNIPFFLWGWISGIVAGLACIVFWVRHID